MCDCWDSNPRPATLTLLNMLVLSSGVFQEGVCILTGLGYNGVVDGQPQWDACANIKVWLFETTPLFGGTIASFNINTNAWAARWVWPRTHGLGGWNVGQLKSDPHSQHRRVYVSEVFDYKGILSSTLAPGGCNHRKHKEAGGSVTLVLLDSTSD